LHTLFAVNLLPSTEETKSNTTEAAIHQEHKDNTTNAWHSLVLVCKKCDFFYFNWVPWQRPLKNRKKLNEGSSSYTRLPILKFWWRSVH